MGLTPMLLLALVLPWALGRALLSLFGGAAGTDRLRRAGLAFAAGAPLLGLAQLAWLAAGAPRERLLLAPAALLVALLAARALRRGRGARGGPAAARTPSGPASGRGAALLFGACLALALAIAADRVVLSSGTLVEGGDESAIYAGKAKALWTAGALDGRLPPLLDRPGALEHVDYPLLDPLLQLSAFAAAGGLTHHENRWPVQAALFALVLYLAGALRAALPAGLAGPLLLVFVAAEPCARAALRADADLLVALGLLVALDGAARLPRADGGGASRPAREAVLALVPGTCLMVFAKHEGALLALLVLGAAALRAAPGQRPLLVRVALAPLAFLALGWAFNLALGLGNDLFEDEGLLARALAGFGARLPAVGGAFLTELLAPGGALLVAALLCAGLGARAGRHAAIGGIALPLALLAYVVVYLGSPHEVGWHLRTSLPRLLLQWQPAALLVVAAACGAALRPARG